MLCDILGGNDHHFREEPSWNWSFGKQLHFTAKSAVQMECMCSIYKVLLKGVIKLNLCCVWVVSKKQASIVLFLNLLKEYTYNLPQNEVHYSYFEFHSASLMPFCIHFCTAERTCSTWWPSLLISNSYLLNNEGSIHTLTQKANHWKEDRKITIYSRKIIIIHIFAILCICMMIYLLYID